MSEPRGERLGGVYILLLNWNAWRDTLACLESLLPDVARGARIVLCDNASSDNSRQHIASWAAGRLSALSAQRARLERLQRHALPRPRVQSLDRAQAEAGRAAADAQLILIDNGANLGFAAGNNVGLRFALKQADMSHVWLLNNDTLVEPDCLLRMCRRLESHPRPAVCGAIIHFFDKPQVIQCIGGNRFDIRSGRARQSAGRYLHEERLPALSDIEQSLDYLSGCCMLLPRAFLDEVGLMNEDYFLYYEEVDWFTRAQRRFDLLVAGGARLYHREGGSIGSRSWRRGPSVLSDLHMFRSRQRFMRRYYPQWLWRCNLSNAMDIVKRLARGQWRNALVIGRVIVERPTESAR